MKRLTLSRMGRDPRLEARLRCFFEIDRYIYLLRFIISGWLLSSWQTGVLVITMRLSCLRGRWACFVVSLPLRANARRGLGRHTLGRPSSYLLRKTWFIVLSYGLSS